MNFNNFKDKKILILGFGMEGKDSLFFLRKFFPQKILTIGDRTEFKIFDQKTQKLIKKDKNIRLDLGKDYLKNLNKYDIIIKSPGISFFLPEIKNAQKKGKVLTSQTKIFLENCPCKIIGITGTKGKSTTTSLIYHILKIANFKVHLVGNIGKPVLSLLLKAKKNDIFVNELSSHQLLNIRKSPKIAVFLNIYPEHLDYYPGFKDYFEAKTNITKFQTKNDYFVFNKKQKLINDLAKKSKAKKIPFNTINIEKIIKTKDIPLMGKFNLENIRAAIAVSKIFNVSDEIFAKAIKTFKALPHRLEFIGCYKEIKFYDDAIATIPEATIVAMETLGNDVQTILLGGFERNLDFTELAKKILKSKIQNVILFPTTGSRIWEAIQKEAEKEKKKKSLESFFVNSMEEAVKLAYSNTDKGKICLLSTASSSFSIFKDYKEKGNLFKKYVKKWA
ncbi:MAG: UDP-N-acetylmuramoyl-L-alanine--D-glutamate ligase [Candidatus Nealsonbacteria bacterium]|nr:UDP-N-acetylmuramoyl-L-alanine--D-glutamate ligase [Candidatus Nealsonbacteria bacterium]